MAALIENDKLRFIYDAGIALFLLGLAFQAGVLHNKVDTMSKRGGVPISMEADQRLTRIETDLLSLERRISRCEP